MGCTQYLQFVSLEVPYIRSSVRARENSPADFQILISWVFLYTIIWRYSYKLKSKRTKSVLKWWNYYDNVTVYNIVSIGSVCCLQYLSCIIPSDISISFPYVVPNFVSNIVQQESERYCIKTWVFVEPPNQHLCSVNRPLLNTTRIMLRQFSITTVSVLLQCWGFITLRCLTGAVVLTPAASKFVGRCLYISLLLAVSEFLQNLIYITSIQKDNFNLQTVTNISIHITYTTLPEHNWGAEYHYLHF